MTKLEKRRIKIRFATDLVCRYCGFIAKSMQGLGSHKHHKHGIVVTK